MKTKNKFDALVKKARTKEKCKSREIGDLIAEILDSRELWQLAQTSTGRPHPICYLGSQNVFRKISDKSIDLRKFYGEKSLKIYFEEFCVYNDPGRRGHPFSVERKTNSYDGGGTASHDYFRLVPSSKREEIYNFAAKLNSGHMIEAGFIYDPELNMLIPYIGKEVKEVSRTNLETCLQKYLITPALQKR